MWTLDVTRAISPSEVSPELLKPLVAVVATLGKLGATAGDVPLAGTLGSLRAGLLSFSSGVRRAMGHHQGQAARLRRALATARATTKPTAATPEIPAVPKEGPGVPKATAEAITHEWQKAVASVEDTWAKLKQDAVCLRDACGTVATARATGEATKSHLVEAVAREAEARKGLLAASRVLPMASEVAEVTEVVAAHEARVAEARAGLEAASKATEAAAVAVVAAATAREQGQQAAVAHELLGHLVAACDGAYHYYCHLQRCLKDIEAAVGAMAAGHGGPESATEAQEGPDVPKAMQGDPGIPKDLAEAVAVAEALWDASARLAQDHLLGTLRVARGLLTTGSVTDATAVVQRCQDATAALPRLLPQGLF